MTSCRDREHGASMSDTMTVHGIDLEVVRRGAGPADGVAAWVSANSIPDARFLRLLSQQAAVIAPSHPGFGRSARPKDFESVYDMVNLYAALLDALPSGQGNAGGVLVRWLAGGGTGGSIVSQDRAAGAGGQRRDQDQRAGNAGHNRRIQHASGRGGAAAPGMIRRTRRTSTRCRTRH